MTELEIHIDGASKGNPGPAAIGVVIAGKNGTPVRNICRYIGETTNNVAEYAALICALEEALLLKAQCLSIKSDSELLCRQMNKVYRVKNEHILALYTQAQRLICGFTRVDFTHVPREQNKEADKLANQAIAEQRAKAA
jgi:ribonuclease HI